MKEFPPVPRAADAPADLFESGHLWLQEYVDGLPLRFSLEASGLVVFGDERTVSRTESMPLSVQHAVRHVRERLDRDALRDAVPAVESITFFGVATTHRVVEYDWDRTPSFLGVDVWSERRERHLPPDTVEKIFERLGLSPVNAFAKEVRAADFDPSSYEIPQSAWYDGPAAGALIRSKTDERAKLLRPDYEAATVDPFRGTAEEVAGEFVTDARIEATVLNAEGTQAGIDAIVERVLEAVIREHHGRLTHDETPFDLTELRSAVAAAVQRERGTR